MACIPADHPYNHGGEPYLLPRATEEVEEQVPRRTVPEPSCGHPFHVADCSKCYAYELACFAEPSDPDEPDACWIEHKVPLPLDAGTAQTVYLD